MTMPIERVEELYRIIADAQAELTRIRTQCPHARKTLGKWMDGPGRIYDAYICDDCGDMVGRYQPRIGYTT